MTYDIDLDVLGPTPRLGFDIGRVLIAPSEGRADTSFLQGSDDDAMHTPPSAGAFEAVARLTAAVDGRAWLVSKCGPNIQRRSRLWLAHWRFHERTGLPADQVRFCRQRRDKAIHCRELALDAFVDDRPDVLHHLLGVVPLRLLFGPQRPGRTPPAGVVPVADWTDVESILMPLIDRAPATVAAAK